MTDPQGVLKILKALEAYLVKHILRFTLHQILFT